MSDLKQLQDRIATKRSELGYKNDPMQLQILLMEEVGEVSKELRQTWSSESKSVDKQALSDELADVFIYVSSLASSFDIDLAKAIDHKFFDIVGARHNEIGSD